MLSLSPSDALKFQVDGITPPRTYLKITNNSAVHALYKVKTTQPNWYYVKPNQTVLAPGESIEVGIAVNEENARKLDSTPTSDLANHRFMVQATEVSVDAVTRMRGLDNTDITAEYSRIWQNAAKDKSPNVKLKVNFDVISSSADVSNKGNVASSRANDDDVRAAAPNGLADLQHSSTPGDALSGIVDTDAPSKDLQSELQNLRKRFDAVLEYTCHLTAERDSIVAQLKETKAKTDRQLARDSEKSVIDANSGVTSSKGIPIFVALLMSLLAFFIGSYFR